MTSKPNKKEHDHPEERRDSIFRNARTAMKRKAVDQPDRSLKQIHTEVLTGALSDLVDAHDLEEITAAIPNFEASRSSIQRARAKARPPLVKERKDLILEGIWTTAVDGGEFLVINDGTDQKILGFCSESCLRIVCSSEAIYMDGTFRVVPRLFEQLYTIHAFNKGQMMPLVYFLLPNKDAETYTLS